MKSIINILNNIRNLIPYLLLISIYFFFVNLEARKENDMIQNNENENILSNNISINDDKILRLKIPVIPYNE